MRVYFTETAYQQIEQTHEYLAGENPRAALEWVDRITRRADQIGTFPRSGRQVPEFERDDLREVFEGDWRIIYLIRDELELIEVLAVVWAKRPLEFDEP